jgi:hypothetical protein
MKVLKSNKMAKGRKPERSRERIKSQISNL